MFFRLKQCSILLYSTLHCIVGYCHMLHSIVLHAYNNHMHTAEMNSTHTHTDQWCSFPSGGSWPEFVTFLLIPCIKNTEKQHKRVKHETISGKWKDPGGEALREREREGSVLISTVGYDRLTWQSRPPAPFDFQFHQRERNKFIFLSLIFLTRLSGCDEARGEILHLHFIYVNNGHIQNSILIVHVCEFSISKDLTRAHYTRDRFPQCNALILTFHFHCDD